MLDVAQAAKLLGVCEETIRRRIREGEITAINIGRENGKRARYRIPEAFLEAAKRTPEDDLELTTRG